MPDDGCLMMSDERGDAQPSTGGLPALRRTMQAKLAAIVVSSTS